jgi:hypothetical protein
MQCERTAEEADFLHITAQDGTRWFGGPESKDRVRCSLCCCRVVFVSRGMLLVFLKKLRDSCVARQRSDVINYLLQGAVQEGFDEPLLSALFRIFSTPFAPGRLVAYACAALVNFTSDLSMATPPALLTHGPAILEQLLRLVSSEHSREDVRLKAMSATAQTASVLAEQGKLTQEMLTASLEIFWPFMSSGDVDETLKARAVDCATLVGEFCIGTERDR